MAEAMRKRAAKTDDPADLAQLLTYEAAEARRRQDEGLALAPGAFSSDSERIVFADLSAVALTAGTNIAQARLQMERIARGAGLQAATSAAAPTAVIVSQSMAAFADSRNAAATAAAAAAGLVPVLEVGPRLDNSAVIGRAVELGRSALAGVAGDSVGHDAIRLAAAQVESDIRASLGRDCQGRARSLVPGPQRLRAPSPYLGGRDGESQEGGGQVEQEIFRPAALLRPAAGLLWRTVLQPAVGGLLHP
jgi:hypothetical protein